MPEETVEFVDGAYAVGAVDLMLDPADCPDDLTPNELFVRVFYPVDKNTALQVFIILINY